MEHYLTQIKIKKLRHLSDIMIELNSEKRQHLLLTGKNGCGKTTVLLAMQKYLKSINDGCLNQIKGDSFIETYSLEQGFKNLKSQYEKKREMYSDGLELYFNLYANLNVLYEQGNFILAYFSADRKTKIIPAKGVEDIKLQDVYSLNETPGDILVKYMVHLKTQQAYARNEADMENVEKIGKWFERFENALRVLFDDETVKLKYNYKEYNFEIIEKGREPFGFDQLSDGYSSVIHIISDLILRMDKNWILKNELSEYDIEGIVLIDELETHLHIELQKKILPFLTTFFPRIQFIVTTHSPYILNSISNAKAYDLEKQMELENLFAYSTEDLAEAYFDSDEYAEELKLKLQKYEELVKKEDITDEERAERANLRVELKNISDEILGEIKDKFEEIEIQRKNHG